MKRRLYTTVALAVLGLTMVGCEKRIRDEVRRPAGDAAETPGAAAYGERA